MQRRPVAGEDKAKVEIVHAAHPNGIDVEIRKQEERTLSTDAFLFAQIPGDYILGPDKKNKCF